MQLLIRITILVAFCSAVPTLSAQQVGEAFGTTDTAYFMPEHGPGNGANDPTPEQFAASAEAQAIAGSARQLAGNDPDLLAAADQFCTWNAGAVVARGAGPEFVQVFDNVYF